jgi:predicted transcriptional regulator
VIQEEEGMPYAVEYLLEKQRNVVVVHKADQITDALDLMIEHAYSQIPVVDEHERLLGMVTYESIMRAIRSFNTKIDKLFVRDAIIGAPSHYREDNLFDLLDELKETNAVVIIEPGGVVVGIVTSYDSSEFMRSRTEDLMHIEDIEFTIKELIKKAHTNEQGEPDSDKLQAAIARRHEPRNEQATARKIKTFEDLTLVDYINLLLAKETWAFFAPILEIQKESLYELLEKVRQTRNDLAHFRGEISPRSRDELKYCANWLRSKYRDYEKEQVAGFINPNTFLKQPDEKRISHTVQEEAALYKPGIEDGKPAAGEGVSRYAALANWLAQQKADQISLSFEQIEKIIRSSLPASALALRAWWANDKVGHRHSILWLEAGWRISYVDLAGKQVIFSRLEPATVR